MKQFFFACLAGSIISLGAITTSKAFPTVVSALWSDEDTINDVIQKFQGTMSALIAEAGGEARSSLTPAYQLADSIIGSLKVAYADSPEKRMKQINGQEKQAFIETRNLLSEIEDASQEPGTKAINMGKMPIPSFCDVLSFAKKPVLTAYTPSFIGPLSLQKTVAIKVSGCRLETAGVPLPKLKIGADEYEAQEINDVSATFVVPREAFGKPQDEPSFKSASINFHGSKANVVSPEINFRLLFTALPEELGEFTVITWTATHTQSRKPSQDFRKLRAARDGGGEDEKHDCFYPDDGYEFDVNSAVAIEDEHRAYKGNDRSGSTNDGKVTFYQNIKQKDKICIQVTAHTNCRECGAWTTGHLRVDLVKDEVVVTQTESERTTLNWRDKFVELTATAKRELIMLRLFRGKDYIISSYRVPNIPFLQITPDLEGGIIRLSPQRLWSSN